MLPESAGVLLDLISSLSRKDVPVIFLVSVTTNLLATLVALEYVSAHPDAAVRHTQSL